MKKLIAGILKSIFNENVIKGIVIALGDHLVKSSKNKLDDVVWKKVRNKLG
jgi:hypothetical protein